MFTLRTQRSQILSSIRLFIAFLFIFGTASAQCVVSSTNGYFVTVSVKPVEIIPASQSCQYGYTYNVRLDYSISFSGNNIPSSLYTLQGTINCGGTSIFFDLPNVAGSGSTISSNAYTSLSNCSNPTVSSLGCNLIQIEIDGPGIVTKSLSCPVAAPLPVRFSSFEAVAKQTQVSLKWSTAWEENNAYFSIQRSENNVNFNDIATVQGNGNSTNLNTYTYTDQTAYGKSMFYRIKQVDNDGHSSYSDIRMVSFAGTGKVSLSPNPIVDHTLFLHGIENFSGYELRIFDINGRPVHQTRLQSGTVQLPTGLSKGNYMAVLVAAATGEKTALRFVKQ
jgi:hypothetical protein